VVWNVIANNIEVSTQVEFIAYPTILNCDNNPEFCFEGDTISFSIPINVEQLFDCTADDGTEGVELWGECYSIENTDTLDLHSNGLTGFIPPEIGNLTNLTTLWLWENQLTGSIPPEIGNLTNLEMLFLYNNQLTGEIPSEIGNLTNLTSLNLYSNQVTGEIPPEIGNLTNLTYLYLGGNQLIGGIPSEIGNLTNLTYLYLYNNQLTGEIPSEIGNLTNLNNLILENNQLTGSIPPEIGNLTNLTHLGLYGNQLTGEIPESICNLVENNCYIDISNNQLCPPYPSCVEDYVGEQDISNCEQVSIIDETLPITYNLHNAYPNPFNPVTTLRYDIPENAFVNIRIYDLKGRLVNTLVSKEQTAGYKAIKWAGVDDKGKAVSAGLYLYTIQAGKFRQTKKMVLLK